MFSNYFAVGFSYDFIGTFSGYYHFPYDCSLLGSHHPRNTWFVLFPFASITVLSKPPAILTVLIAVQKVSNLVLYLVIEHWFLELITCFEYDPPSSFGGTALSW